ncbi:phosphatidate cytidylyltransferase [Paenibacillus sambharensis]|uniref:Phosphatidate cytidylyltransferase n=1 Tax=Paenibacillus sambharensis TaxID=1803190 RepID=A0A2W1L1W6_9BACL|nr:phosphatidate cytidylyltransferase [Paenibacillus sambharensis]PZD93356.1 phosphatidate cytidylyltransferase [Paenibacillus sambharensis]
MKQRMVTGVFAGLVFGIMAILGGWFYEGLLLFLAVVGYFEFVRLNGYRWFDLMPLIGFAGMLVIVTPWEHAGLSEPSLAAVVWILMLLLLSVTVVTKNRETLDASALLLLGAVYVGYGFSEMMTVRAHGDYGLLYTAIAFGCIWASDIGAYFVGRAVGRTKLWPAISPNKTIEGAVGGIVMSLIVGVLFWLAAPAVLTIGHALLIGLLASSAGQFGDLIQSAYKRLRGVKDSGRLLPGHGGVLDRCDSWLIVFPLLTLTGLLA